MPGRCWPRRRGRRRPGHETAVRHRAGDGGHRHRAGHPGGGHDQPRPGALSAAGRGALTITHARARTAGLAGGSLAVAAVLLAAVVSRAATRPVLVLGSVLQVLVIGAGALVPVMYALCAIFAGFWVLAIWMGRRAESS